MVQGPSSPRDREFGPRRDPGRVQRASSSLWSRDLRGRLGGRPQLSGVWEEKYWKNFPGPIYSTMGNTLSCGAYNTEGSGGLILYDEDCEFLWRQPQNESELAAVLYAIEGDEVESYQANGNELWTLGLIRDWWSRRREILRWITVTLSKPTWLRIGDRSQDPFAVEVQTLLEYRRFLRRSAARQLQRYAYFLLDGRLPDAGAALPSISGSV